MNKPTFFPLAEQGFGFLSCVALAARTTGFIPLHRQDYSKRREVLTTYQPQCPAATTLPEDKM